MTHYDVARERIVELLAADRPNPYARDDADVPMDDELEGRAARAKSNLLSTRDELSKRMREARDAMEKAELFIRGEPSIFNSRGILQGEGPAIDRLCGVFDVQVDVAVDAEAQLLKARAARADA